MSSLLYWGMLAIAVLPSLDAGVTLKTVRTSGGDYPATTTGLQNAVDYCRTLASTSPCVVEVEAGVTIAGNWIALDNQTPSKKLIVIRSSKVGELAPRTRVTTSDTAKLFRLEQNADLFGAIHVRPNTVGGAISDAVASHYLLTGIDAYYNTNGRNAYGLISIGIDTDGITKARQLWQLPHTIVVDKVLAHGQASATWITSASASANQIGLLANGRNITVRNSRFYDNNMDSTDHGQGESRGLTVDNGTVAYFYNNHIDGAIGSLVGGQTPWIAWMVPTSFHFWGNYYTRDPVLWHWEDFDTSFYLDTTQSCVTGAFWQEKVAPLGKWECIGGVWTPSVVVRTNRAWVKNGFEVKNGRGVLAEGNYIYNIASTFDQSQVGTAVLLNNVDNFFDNNYSARPEYITFNNNRIAQTGQAFTISWGGNPNVFVNTNNITINNNMIENFGGSLVSPTVTNGVDQFTSGGGTQVQASGVAKNFNITNNTFIYQRNFGGTGMAMEGLALNTSPTANVTIRDNLWSWASTGNTPLSYYNLTCSAFIDQIDGGGLTWNNQALIDTNSLGAGTYTTYYSAGVCPATNQRIATMADVRFVDYNSGQGGDYRLCTGAGTPAVGCPGASPAATTSSTSGPLGVNWTQVDYASGGAEAGTPDYHYMEMKITRANPGGIAYTSYGSSACTGEIVNTNTNSVVDSWTDAGGTNRYRTHTPISLSAAPYTVNVTCDGRIKSRQYVDYN